MKKSKQSQPNSNNSSSSRSNAPLADTALGEKVWEAIKNEGSLTPRNLTKVLEKHGFTIETGSGSSHYNVKPPEELKGLGSFTLTPKLNKYLLRKMVEKNFEQFFERHAKQPVSNEKKSEGNEKQPEVNKTVIVHAYDQVGLTKKEELKQTLSELSAIEDITQLKQRLEALEPQLQMYPDLLISFYFNWLEVFNTIDESISIMKKIANLNNHPEVQNSELLKDAIPVFLYYHYADHIKKLMDKLDSENLSPSERFYAIEKCITLHLHILSMLPLPPELCDNKLCDNQYPILKFNGVDNAWNYSITTTAQSFISSSTQLFENVTDHGKVLTGFQYDFEPMEKESSSSSFSEISLVNGKSVNNLTDQTVNYVKKYAGDLPMKETKVSFDWHLLAYSLARVRLYQNKIHTLTLKTVNYNEMYFWGSAITLFEYAERSFVNLGKLITRDEVISEIFSSKMGYANALIKNKQYDKAGEIFMGALKKPIQLDENNERDSIFLRAITSIAAVLVGYFIDNIGKGKNRSYIFEINEFLEKNYGFLTNLSNDSLKEIAKELNAIAQNIKLLKLKVNPEDQKTLDTFIGENRSKLKQITSAMKDFQLLIVREKLDADEYKNKANVEREKLVQELMKDNSKKNKKN